MANRGSRKQITFDLSQDKLKRYYPVPLHSRDAKYYKKAYKDVFRFMKKHKFEHRQYSVYISEEKMTTVDVAFLMQDLQKEYPWFFKCANEIDVTNIGTQHSLLHSADGENAGFDQELDLSL